MAIIDLVRWEPGADLVYAWKFPHNNLSTYTQLIVAESQEAILFSKGQIIGKFGPGKHTLHTENLPLLRSLYGLPFGGKNPFTAEVWFVNKLLPLNIDWATDSMMYHDPDYNSMVPMIASGRYGLKVVDAERFLIKLVGTAYSFTDKQLTDNFRGALVSKTKSTLLQFMMSQRIGIKSISAFLDPLSENLRASMLAFWEGYGFELIAFYVTTIEVDANNEAGARILDAISRQSAQNIGGYTWQQSQVFELGDKAVDKLGGGGDGQGGGQGGLIGAVLATNMMGSLSGSGLMNPISGNVTNPLNQGPVVGGGSIGTPPTKDVYCSNCSKKFSSSMKFCPSCGDPYIACPKCGADNDVNAKRCVSCGTTFNAASQVCSNCQTVNPVGTAFCSSCGRPFESKEGCCKRCGIQLNNLKFCPQCGFKNM